MSERLVPAPVFLPDFDGVLVQFINLSLIRRHGLRAASQPIEGEVDFCEGVAYTGVEMGEIVSSRPNLLLVRRSMDHAMANIGLKEVFPDIASYKHFGGLRSKAEFEVERSLHRTVGTMEDWAYLIGKNIMRALDRQEQPTHPIVMGVVAGEGKTKDIFLLADFAETTKTDDIEVSEDDHKIGNVYTPRLTVRSERHSFEVVQQPPYSWQAGVEFGDRLLKAA